MKTLTKVATLALILGTNTLLAYDDYALTDNYKLLNDMKLAQKQQEVIVNINNQLNKNIIDIKSLKNAQERFNKVLIGLSNGDQSLNLKGTNIHEIKVKLSEVQKIWKIEKTMLNSITEENKEKAISKLNIIMLKMSEAIALYNKSYERFKQKSKISSIVNKHINSNRIFAFNTIQ
jgi:S-methylmethionine-dependent homocysteine/selenocysteine methylase